MRIYFMITIALPYFCGIVTQRFDITDKFSHAGIFFLSAIIIGQWFRRRKEGR